MASFEGSIGIPSGGFNLKVEYTITQSITGNYSDVTATGYVKRNNSSYYPYNTQSSSSLVIDGTSKSYTGSYNLGSDGYKQITSNTKRVYHNDDGTKSITISFSFNGLLSNYYPNGSISQTITLPTIPRASGVSCSSPYIGDAAIITIDKKTNSFTNTVTYDIGGITGTIATKTTETVLSLNTETLKSQIYALIPNAKSTTGTIYCTTYNGDTQIGSTQSTTFNLYAKEEDCKPIMSGVVIDTNADTIALTGDNSIIVKNASKPKVTITATPKYSSTISSYNINLNDGQTSNQREQTFDTINSNLITVSAIDSREYGNSSSIDLANRIVDYVKLHFNTVDLQRPEGTSNEVVLNANGVWFNGDFSQNNSNTLTCTFVYKKSSDTNWTNGGTITPTISNNTFTFNNVSLGNVYDYDSEYQFKIIATDLLMTVGNESTDAQTVPKGQEVVTIGEDTVWVYGNFYVNDEELPEVLNTKSNSQTKTYSCNFMLNYCHPVGEVFMTTNSSFNPNTSWGGTWVQLTGDDYLKIVTSNAGNEGGTSNEHKIPEASMPSHRHKTSTRTSTYGSGQQPDWRSITAPGSAYGDYTEDSYSEYTGGGQAYYPYYYGVYAWHRTA